MREPSSPISRPFERGSRKCLAVCSSYGNIPSIPLGVTGFPVVVTLGVSKNEPKRRRITTTTKANMLRPTLWQALQYPNQETEAQRMRVTPPPPPRPQASELGRGGHQELNRGMSESRAWSRLRTADSPSLEWRRPWRRSPIPVGLLLPVLLQACT